MTVESPPREQTPAARRRHRGRRTLLAVGAVLTVLALVAAWFRFAGEGAEQSSESQARLRLPSSTGGAASTVGPGGGQPLTAPPTIGLYRYQGSGREHTTFPPLTEDQGPAMPATVSPGPDGCWVLQIDYNTHHWQRWTYCTAGGELRERSNSTFSRRSVGGIDIDNTSELTCEPVVLVLSAADRPEATRPRSCVGHGTFVPAQTTVAGTITVVGSEQVDVGGTAVSAVHVHYDLTLQGGQSGTQVEDTWFASSTGLPVRNEHHTTAVTDTPLGRITYTEDAAFQLQTAQPV